jgi:hypothetical protein
MAISIKAQPRFQSNPAYNPIVYVFDSTEKSRAAFRYIVELYDQTGGAKIADFRIAPRTGDGYGYIDVSGILKNYVDKALVFNTDYDATNSTAFRYRIHIGEEYLLTAGYDNVVDVGGFLTFQRFTSPHGLTPLDIGSTIEARNTFQFYNDGRQRVNGFHVIKSIPSGFEIQTTTPWSLVSGPIVWSQLQGLWNFAGRRNFIAPTITRLTGIVLNQALSLDQYKTNIDLLFPAWRLNGISHSLMTNMPETEFSATVSQHAFLHAYNESPNIVNFVYFENSNGGVYRRAFTSPNLPIVTAFAVGPGNLGAPVQLSGPVGPVIQSNTEWYDVYVAGSVGNRLCKKYRFNLDRRCKINDIQILFMDRQSSWLSYSFQLRQTENIETNKMTYRQETPKVSTPGWVTIQRTDKGTQTFHSSFKKRHVLNTNWMNDAMSVYFEELLTSPYTYINYGDGEWYGCQVEDGTFETLRYKNERLIRKTISVYASIDAPVQDAGTITQYIGRGYNLGSGFTPPGPGDITPPPPDDSIIGTK